MTEALNGGNAGQGFNLVQVQRFAGRRELMPDTINAVAGIVSDRAAGPHLVADNASTHFTTPPQLRTRSYEVYRRAAWLPRLHPGDPDAPVSTR